MSLNGNREVASKPCRHSLVVLYSEEASQAYFDASSRAAASPPRAGMPPSLLDVERAQVRAIAGGGCGGGGGGCTGTEGEGKGEGRGGGGAGAGAGCPWAYRRADDVEAAPRKAACHKKKRSFTDRPTAAAILALRLTNDNTAARDYGESDRVAQIVSEFVAEWTAAGAGEEVVVVLVGGGGGADDEAPLPPPTVAALTDRLMKESQSGENHHLVYTPAALTPAQALDRGLRMAVSPVGPPR